MITGEVETSGDTFNEMLTTILGKRTHSQQVAKEANDDSSSANADNYFDLAE